MPQCHCAWMLEHAYVDCVSSLLMSVSTPYVSPLPLSNPRADLIKNPSKNNLCLEDGGGTTLGTKTRLFTCNAASDNQQFNFTPAARGTQVQALKKSNLCLDSNGQTAGSLFHLWSCDVNNANQQFEFVKTREIRLGGYGNLGSLCQRMHSWQQDACARTRMHPHMHVRSDTDSVKTCSTNP